MNKEEILAMSREENKNKDLVTVEIEKKAGTFAVITVTIMAAIFFAAEIMLCGNVNYGLASIALAVNAAINLYTGIRTKDKKSIIYGVIWGLATLADVVTYFAVMITTSPIL